MPLGYLLCLMLLFLLLVLDRVCYTVASPLGKAVLHLGEMVLYFAYCLQLFWSPLTSAGACRSVLFAPVGVGWDGLQ